VCTLLYLLSYLILEIHGYEESATDTGPGNINGHSRTPTRCIRVTNEIALELGFSQSSPPTKVQTKDIYERRSCYVIPDTQEIAILKSIEIDSCGVVRLQV
jgi:hypothetical protein